MARGDRCNSEAPTCAKRSLNWLIHPAGRAAELAALEKAVEVMRAAQPYVVTGAQCDVY